jgi:hypothetical protein
VVVFVLAPPRYIALALDLVLERGVLLEQRVVLLHQFRQLRVRRCQLRAQVVLGRGCLVCHSARACLLIRLYKNTP